MPIPPPLVEPRAFVLASALLDCAAVRSMSGQANKIQRQIPSQIQFQGGGCALLPPPLINSQLTASIAKEYLLRARRLGGVPQLRRPLRGHAALPRRESLGLVAPAASARFPSRPGPPPGPRPFPGALLLRARRLGLVPQHRRLLRGRAALPRGEGRPLPTSAASARSPGPRRARGRSRAPPANCSGRAGRVAARRLPQPPGIVPVAIAEARVPLRPPSALRRRRRTPPPPGTASWTSSSFSSAGALHSLWEGLGLPAPAAVEGRVEDEERRVLEISSIMGYGLFGRCRQRGARVYPM